MVNISNVAADFQFVRSRISNFQFKTNRISTNDKANVSMNIDYSCNSEKSKNESAYSGSLELLVEINAKAKGKLLFKIEMIMEGIFIGNSEKNDIEKFNDMLKINGVVTLLQLCRAYILSVSALFGLNPPLRIPMINVLKLKEEKEKTSK